MTKAGRRRVAFQFGAMLTALTAVLSVGLVPARQAHAQVSSLPLQFSDVVIFATNSARLGSNAQVVAGHVAVNNSSPGPTLTSGFELGIASNVHTPAGYAIVGDSIQVLSNAVIGGNAFFNNLSNAGTIQGSQNTPLPPFPIFAPLPTFQPSTPGTLDVTVPANQTQTLAPGNYRDIHVLSNGTLRLSAGVYNVRSILTDSNAKILFQNLASGKADVRVQNQLTTGSNGIVRSDDADPLKAAKIIFYVGFASGAGLTPNAVTFGSNGTIHANVYAPNGTVRLDSNVNATGAFLGRDVDLGTNVHVDLETFFNQQAPAITSANATTFTVGQAGTFTVTTTGFPTPSITRGGAALPSGVTFTDNGNGTGTLSGTPAAATGGTYAITFTANNGVSPDAVQNFTLTVNQAPAITSASATTFTVGTPGSFTVTTSGFPAPSITRGGVALPAGVTFTDNGNGTGTLSGTPAAGTGGTYAITFTATNTAGSSPTQNFTLTVNQAPAITSANSTTFFVGQAGSFMVTTTGFPAASIARGGAGLPAGVTFVNNGNGTGTLSGTPAAGTAGNYAITFTATNAAGSSPTQNFTLTVAQAPTITTANATTFTVGQLGSFTVTTTGFPPASIAQGGTLPAGVTFVSNGDGTGTLSGTPAAGTGGTYALTFTATNVAGSSPTQNFTLTVNQAPAITSANSTTFIIGQPGSFIVTTTGFPTPSIAQGGALPSGVNFVDNLNGTGTLSGTPAAGTGGSYPLTFTASNGVPPNAVQNFTLGVSAPPSAVNDGPYLTDANTTFSRATTDPDDLLDNDSLGFPVASLTSFGGGSLGGTVTSNAAGTTANFGTGGSLVVQSNGAFTFTPSTGFTGVFTFQYRLTNTAGTSDATVTINVRPKAVGDLFNQTVIGNVNINAAFSVVANDVFNAPVMASLVSPFSANGGEVSLDGGGLAFTYNPPVGFQGNDTFTYTITDASGFTSAPATVTVPVAGMIWFVNNNAGACSSLCNGRLTNPFITLQAFTSVNDGVGTHPANNQSIFAYESATPYTYSTGTILRTGQKLIGQDATATLASIAGVTVPSGSTLPAMNTGAPATTIGSTVALAANSTVRGLSIVTLAATGLSGGAVSGVTTSEASVTTTSAAAVDLNGTSGILSLSSVSSIGGSVPGISLTNTTGSFTVTGDGGGVSNGSGGTISGKTGAFEPSGTPGVRLNTAQNVRLNYVTITGNNHSGILGTNVNGFQLDRCVISNNGDGIGVADETGVDITNLTGTAIGGTNPTSIANCTISNNREFQVQITNTAGTLTDLQWTNNIISSNGLGTIGNLVNFLGSGTADMTLNVSGGSVTGAAPNTATGVQCDTGGGSMTCNITGATFTNNNVGVSVSSALAGNLTFDVHDNPSITGNRSHGLNLFVNANATGSANGKFRNNVIGTQGVAGSGSSIGFGIRVQNEGVDTTNPANVLITGNTIQEMTSFPGVNVNQGIIGQTSSRTTNATIVNNVIRDVHNSRAIVVQQNNATVGDPDSAGTTCVDISGNDMSNIAGNVGDGTKIRIRQLDANGGDVNVRQLAPTAAVAANELDDANSVGSHVTTAAEISLAGAIDFGTGPCPQP